MEYRLRAAWSLKIRLLSRHYLYMDIQKKYNIRISERHLCEQKFSTIAGIAEIINTCLHKEDDRFYK